MCKPKKDNNKQSNQGSRLINDKLKLVTPQPDNKREQATNNNSEKR